MSGSRGMLIKFGAFALVMVLLTISLFFIFGQYQTGSKTEYSAVFTDVSRLKQGQTVRVAGVRVGTVNSVELRADKKVLVKFDADRDVVLTNGTRAVIRYLNLVGDRYLELLDGPGSTQQLKEGAEIPIDRTAPALDLDLLLGGLRPVTKGLKAEDVNALSASLIEVFQGEGATLQSLLSRTSSFSNTLADNGETVQALIDNLNTVVNTVNTEGTKFSGAIDRLERLISGLSSDRDTIGAAITALDNGTASIADLLTRARPPLAGTVDQLNRLAPLLDNDKNLIDVSLKKLPNNYRKLTRLGAYGAWFPYYLCGLALRVSDLQYRTVEVGVTHQVTGRCAEPDA
ncbi:mammalian cell entry protein [Mycobacterium asiaticum]|uniref:Mammalian cell entry protein n=1 Tax=Mycobacterium asiaticum TaxID=1790 RepID=A0A1A3NJA5_MYCAS|nr:MCE family protein [Mycobacterium asiaticum]OBK21891.1 mammalian cell entry protein [Mycobacterium asiaticum]